MSRAPLVIVIPAYKARFLAETLASIAAQDCRDFRVVVGDDASPEDLHSLCRAVQGQFELHYHRFEHNLGRADLVAHWTRCIALSHEPWVWLFSDDDRMPPDAVSRVLRAVREQPQGELWHFDVERIDADGRVLRREPVFPPRFSARGFARARLAQELSSFAPDYVFSRAAWNRIGGFVNFPRAWCADDATWIALAARGGIATLPGAPVQWRESGLNISAAHAADAPEKWEAQLLFLRWLGDFLRAHPAGPGEPDDATVLAPARRWLMDQAYRLRLPLLGTRAGTTAQALVGLPGVGGAGLWAAMARTDLRLLARRLRSRRRGQA